MLRGRWPLGIRVIAYVAVFAELAALALPCSAAEVVGNTVNDVVVGRNTKGPYKISWTNIDASSIIVIVNGRTLRKGDDYSIDATNGTISFSANVLNDTIVRVSYDIIPNKSKQNSGKVNVPITLSVFQRQDASLQVTGIYSQDDASNPDATKTVLGLGGEKKWSQSKLTSQLFVSQRNDDDSAQNGSTWERSAFRLGTETDTGRLRLTTSMVHAGSEFTGGNETGLGTGKDSRNLALVFSPGKAVQVGASMTQTSDTAGTAKGNDTTVMQQNLSVAPSSATKIDLVHKTTETSTAAAGSETTVDSTTATVNGKLGGNTNATVSFENSSVESNGQTDNIQSIKATASTAPVKQVNMNVSLAQTNSDSQGKQGQYSVAGTVKPVDQVTVTAAHSITQNGTTEQTQTNVGLNATPLKNVQLTGNLATQNSNSGLQQFSRNFAVTSKPFDFAKITATMAQTGVNQDDDVTKAAAVELSPFANTQIKAGYTYTECGVQVMTIRDYAATTKPFRFLSVSGTMRDREVRDNTALDTHTVQLALSPAQYLTLTGAYQANPEDKNGQVQAYNAASLGMKMRFGSVGVTTDYSSKEEYMIGRSSDEKALGLDMPVFRTGKLTTGVKLSRFLDGSEFSTRTYSLGFSHAVGSALSLSLTGYYTNHLQNNVAMPDKTEYSAEASIGMKF